MWLSGQTFQQFPGIFTIILYTCSRDFLKKKNAGLTFEFLDRFLPQLLRKFLSQVSEVLAVPLLFHTCLQPIFFLDVPIFLGVSSEVPFVISSVVPLEIRQAFH